MSITRRDLLTTAVTATGAAVMPDLGSPTIRSQRSPPGPNAERRVASSVINIDAGASTRSALMGAGVQTKLSQVHNIILVLGRAGVTDRRSHPQAAAKQCPRISI
jgi:hypothetical protein